jgi:hypothetical protein
MRKGGRQTVSTLHEQTEKMGVDGEAGRDGRCGIRLIEALQEAIGDILSDHARLLAMKVQPTAPSHAAGSGRNPEAERKRKKSNGFAGRSQSGEALSIESPAQESREMQA